MAIGGGGAANWILRAGALVLEGEGEGLGDAWWVCWGFESL